MQVLNWTEGENETTLYQYDFRLDGATLPQAEGIRLLKAGLDRCESREFDGGSDGELTYTHYRAEFDGTIEQRNIRRAAKQAERDAYRAADPIGFAVEYGYGEMVNGVYVQYEEWEDYDGADYVDELV